MSWKNNKLIRSQQLELGQVTLKRTFEYTLVSNVIQADHRSSFLVIWLIPITGRPLLPNPDEQHMPYIDKLHVVR